MITRISLIAFISLFVAFGGVADQKDTQHIVSETKNLAMAADMVRAGGLDKLAGLRNVEYAIKYPFFLESLNYLSRNLSDEDLLKYHFKYTSGDTVEVFYDKNFLFKVSHVAPKFSRFLINEYRIQLRKYKKFKDYLSVAHQIFYTKKQAPGQKSKKRRQKLVPASKKKSANLLQLFLWPQAHAGNQKQAVTGVVLVTALVAYGEVRGEIGHTFLAECKRQAGIIENVVQEALLSCFKQIDLEFDSTSLEPLEKYILSKFRDNYSEWGDKFAPFIDSLAEEGTGKKFFRALNTEFYPNSRAYIQHRFPNEAMVVNANACQDQLVNGFDHLLLPSGDNAEATLKARVNATAAKMNFRTHETFWLFANRRRQEFTPCLTDYLGPDPIPPLSPLSESDSLVPAEKGFGRGKIFRVEPEVVTFKGKRPEPTYNQPTGNLADELKAAVPEKPKRSPTDTLVEQIKQKAKAAQKPEKAKPKEAPKPPPVDPLDSGTFSRDPENKDLEMFK